MAEDPGAKRGLGRHGMCTQSTYLIYYMCASHRSCKLQIDESAIQYSTPPQSSCLGYSALDRRTQVRIPMASETVGNRTRVARVRAGCPNQLDCRGSCDWMAPSETAGNRTRVARARAGCPNQLDCRGPCDWLAPPPCCNWHTLKHNQSGACRPGRYSSAIV